MATEGDGCFPKCTICGIQVDPTNQRHRLTGFCREGAARQEQYLAAANSARALERKFYAYGEELERVEVFKYLGRLLAYDDSDVRTVRRNITKARKCWRRISRVLRAEEASPRVSGVFYRATVQAVLLYGSETWAITPTILKSLEGFHIRAAYRMASVHKPRQDPEGMWIYPESTAVLAEVGLRRIDHYIGVRRSHIAKYIVDRPIFDACRGGERRRGTCPRQLWWEQPLDIGTASAEATADADVAGP